MKKNKILITAVLMFLFTMCLAPITTFAATEIGDIEIENVKFNYDPGDAPQANATPMDGWYGLYSVEYEYWEEMETNEKGESVPVKYWYSDKSKNDAIPSDKRITTFEEGKTYMYSISLKTEDDNTFAVGKKVKINGAYVDNKNVTNSGTRLFVVAVKTIKPETITYKHISEVEINNAAISFNVGDKPVFTGTTPNNVPYIYQSEYWSTDGGKKYYYAADFWNINNPDDLFTEFESSKSYTYGIYFKAAEGYCFTTDTKLKINGKYYDYYTTDYDPLLQYNEGEYATMWVDTSLIMTPTENSQENPIIPSEPENPSQEPVTPTELAQGTEKEPQTTENKTEQINEEINNPKTGDSVLIFATIFGLIGITTLPLISRKSVVK
jgi:hypothetical protein